MTDSIHVRTGTPEVIAREVVHLLALAASDAVLRRGIFSMAIPGGSVAEAVLPLLTEVDLPWHHVHLFWVDERAVPSTDSASNAGRARLLLANSHMHGVAFVHGIQGSDSDLDFAAEAYARVLVRVAGDPPILDLVLLGVGEDGHVASLFPGHDALTDTHSTVIVERNAPKEPPGRITLALPVLTNARETMIVAFGASKAAVMREALEDGTADTPVARVVREGARVMVMLDNDAASQLTSTPVEHVT